MRAPGLLAAVRLWAGLRSANGRWQRDGRLTEGLAVAGFAVSTGAALTVIAGALALIARDAETFTYPALAASVILVVPITGLASAVTRLAVSRRNARLAAMRLAGATTAQVGLIALLDAVSQALVGAVLGVAVYLAALPGVAMIVFEGRPFAYSELLLPVRLIAAVVAGVVLLATGSALVALSAVVISPLGVAQRRTPARVTIIRAAVLVAALVAWARLTRPGEAPEVLAMIIVVGLVFAAFTLVGPLVLRLVGSLGVATARSAPMLLAARRLLDDPRATWRMISGVVLATFVAGLMSIGPAVSADVSQASPGETIGADLSTGSVVTLVIAALLAAASAGVTQAARVLDQRDHYRVLHLAGTEVGVLQRTRLYEVALPLVVCLAIAAGLACLLIAPFGLSLITQAPEGLMIFAGGVVGAAALVLAAVAASAPLVSRVALARVRTPD